MFNKTLIKSDFNKAAKTYNEFATLQDDVASQVVAHAKKYFPHETKILDIGSGTGFIAQKSNWNTTQLDISYGMCEYSCQYAPAVNADMEALPFADQSFDGIASSLALQWATQPRKVFSEIFRVLQNNGTAVLATFGSDTLKELKQLFSIVSGSEHVSPFLPQYMLEKLMEKAGFIVIDSQTSTITQHHEDVKTLLKSIKKIGANNKLNDRKRYFSKSTLHQLEEGYNDGHSSAEGIKSTWEVIYLIGKKNV